MGEDTEHGIAKLCPVAERICWSSVRLTTQHKATKARLHCQQSIEARLDLPSEGHNCLKAQNMHTHPSRCEVTSTELQRTGNAEPRAHLHRHRPPRSQAPALQLRDPGTPRAPTCPHRRCRQRALQRLGHRPGSARTARRHLVFVMSCRRHWLTLTAGVHFIFVLLPSPSNRGSMSHGTGATQRRSLILYVEQ